MSPPGWVPGPGEQSLGLGFFATSTPGVPGRLKVRPQEFQVREVSLYPLPDAAGPFTVLRVESSGWEQHELAGRLAARLGLPAHAVAWAGTKDRRAVAERLMSYRGEPPSGELGLPNVRLLDAYRARSGLVLGHHFGNAFRIRLELEPATPDPDAALQATLDALQAQGRFPNFFGPQRFGEVRPITHEVGRQLLKGDVDGAVDVYLTARPPSDDTFGVEARRAYAEHRDAARALQEFPPALRFERTLLEHLARGHTSERALRALGHELRTLFVHAYQAYLFNLWLGRREALGLPMDAAVAGDTILRVGRDGTVSGRDAVPVGSDNAPECSELVGRGRAYLAGPLVGYATPRGRGPAGEILDSLLEQQGLTIDAFRLPASPELASRGTFRPAWLPVPPIGLRVEPAGSGGPGAWFTFALPKGCYATVLLREFTKAGATPIRGPLPPTPAAAP